MINKFYKIIHNKFSRFFKFIFFIRYLLSIFFVSIVLFLSIPHFFDYKKKEDLIKNYLANIYELEIQKMGEIKFRSFPVPHYEILNLFTKVHSEESNLKIKKLLIYPKLTGIYNFKNFKIERIKLENNDMEVNLGDMKFLQKLFFNPEKKMRFENLNINITDKNKEIIILKNINFKNYGYKKNKIDGFVFNEKFKASLLDNPTIINFKILKTGIKTKLQITEKNKDSYVTGIFEGKILNSNFKLNFFYNKNLIKFDKFYFRDKKISLDSQGYLQLKPFSKIKISSEVNNIDKKIFNKLDITYLLQFKNLIKKINSQNEINFKSKRFSSDLINDFYLKTDLAYGRLLISKNFSISKTNFICESNINLLDQFPILYFECSIKSPDKKDLLKKFEINYKTKNEALNFLVNGNLNIKNNKINFNTIKLENQIEINAEDLQFLKSSFENILFDEKFIRIFNLSKIKKFISEIS